MVERNIGLEVAERLVEVHGFEINLERPDGQFIRIVDSQHAAVVDFSKWDRPAGGGLTAAFSFGVARRDINDLLNDFSDSVKPSSWKPTVYEWPTFFDDGRPGGGFSDLKYSADEMAAWVDLWVPRLVEECPNYRFVREKLLERQAETRRQNNGSRVASLMMDKLLDGVWTDADDEEFLEPVREAIRNRPPEHVAHKGAIRRLAWLAAWLEEHPDGVERELVD